MKELIKWIFLKKILLILLDYSNRTWKVSFGKWNDQEIEVILALTNVCWTVKSFISNWVSGSRIHMHLCIIFQSNCDTLLIFYSMCSSIWRPLNDFQDVLQCTDATCLYCSLLSTSKESVLKIVHYGLNKQEQTKIKFK